MKEDRYTKVLAKLLQETQDRTLLWEVGKPPRDLTTGTDDVIDTVFIAVKKDRFLRLYPYKRKYYSDEFNFYWDDRVTLEISDKESLSWWQFPKNPIIWDLLEAVNFNTIDVDGFMNDIISEEE